MIVCITMYLVHIYMIMPVHVEWFRGCLWVLHVED